MICGACAQLVIGIMDNQVLVWLGALYAPALPLFGLAANLLTFHVKRTLALYLNTPPKEHYSASRTNVIFYTLLLGALTLETLNPKHHIAPDAPPSPFHVVTNPSISCILSILDLSSHRQCLGHDLRHRRPLLIKYRAVTAVVQLRSACAIPLIELVPRHDSAEGRTQGLGLLIQLIQPGRRPWISCTTRRPDSLAVVCRRRRCCAPLMHHMQAHVRTCQSWLSGDLLPGRHSAVQGE